jgi:hypothetical protein
MDPAIDDVRIRLIASIRCMDRRPARPDIPAGLADFYPPRGGARNRHRPAVLRVDTSGGSRHHHAAAKQHCPSSTSAHRCGDAHSDLFDMRKMILALAILYPAAVLAQGTTPAPAPPPTVGGKPLVQVKPKAAAAKSEKPAKPGKPQSIAQKLQACQEIDDATKERLMCYDTVFKPEPKPKAPAAKGVNECRFLKEEDERLTCYNGFADKIPKLPQ